MFATLGRLVAANPWKVIAVWIVAFAAIVPFSPSLADVTNEDQTSFLPSSDESMRAQDLAERHFPTASGATARFVLKREDGQALSAADRTEIREFAGALEAAGVAAVNSVETGPEQLAENERAQLVQVAFQGEAADEPVKDAVKELRDEAAVLLAGSRLQAGLTGDAASVVDTEESFGNAETITFAATFVLILLLVGGIFRSPIAAFLPLATIGLVFLLSTSLVALLSDTFGFEVDASLTSLLIVVLFGIGTDYILFLLFRYRERLRAGDESRAAVAFSVRRVGQAVASSALVVIIAFLALLLARLGFFRTMAPGLVISVAVTLLASLTLIPAAIALVGPRVFWPSKRWQTAPTGTTFKRLSQLIARRPGRMALASGGAMLALAAGAIFYTANYDTSSSLPSDTESSQANEDIRGAFAAGAADPTDVYVSGSAPLQQSELTVLVTELRAIDGVDSVGEPILSEDRTGARIGVNLTESATSNAALDVAEGPLRNVAHASTAGDEIRVGGASSAFADIRSALERDILVVFPIAALLIALVLGLLLRSVIAPLYLLGAVALGFVATLGAGVALFQGLGSEPGLLFILPVLLYMFVVAIGTDYNILMTTRLREEMQEGNDPRTAADLAVEHAGPTVVSAGIILAGTFASLGLTGISLLVQLGATIAIGVIIVSFVMATVLVPSLSALIGKRVWWPGQKAVDPVAAEERSRPEPRPSGEPAPVGER
jgi:putative drug exporter of the RND superfamily